jgi:hypothetical protein
MSTSMMIIIIELVGGTHLLFFAGAPMQFTKFSQAGLTVSRMILGKKPASSTEEATQASESEQPFRRSP